MDEHELLLRHAERWAAEQDRPFDRDLVGLVVRLRADHDGLAANLWPGGSAEHLMLERWPAHGPVGPPDIDTLLASLDTYWRFLRATGRMAAASAEPALLRKEAKRAAKRMPAACADTSRYGAAKSLLGFGNEIGLALEDVADEDQFQARLQQITDAWNALPIDERRRRSGATVGIGGFPGSGLPDESDGLDDSYVPNDPSVSAPYIRSSEFIRKVLDLAAWVGDGREVTATDVLRPAVAREAYAALDLWSWEQRSDLYALAATNDDPAAAEAARVALSRWRTAADCLPLDRLWLPAVTTGLVRIKGRRATYDATLVPTTDDEWTHLGLGLLLFLTYRMGEVSPSSPLLGVLLSLQPELGGPTTEDELKDWWWDSPTNARSEGLSEVSWGRQVIDAELSRCLRMFDDCGLWIHEGSRLVATPLSWDFALTLIQAQDSGYFD